MTESSESPPLNKEEAWEWLVDRVDRLHQEVKELKQAVMSK